MAIVQFIDFYRRLSFFRLLKYCLVYSNHGVHALDLKQELFPCWPTMNCWSRLLLNQHLGETS